MRYLWLLLLCAPSLLAAPCDVVVSDQGGRSVPSATFSALHYESKFRIYVKTTTVDCKWSLDVAGSPQWLTFQVADGRFVPRLNAGFTGPAVLDVTFAANGGFARSGKFTIHAPAYDIRLFVDQNSHTGLCFHKPITADSTESALQGEGEFLLLLRRWGGKKVTSPRIIYQVTDSSGCPADGILYATTPRFAGSTIITTGVFQKGQPIVISAPYAEPNLMGEGAIFGLRGNGQVAPSAIGVIVLPAASTLPADLQITRQGFLPSWAVFASTGGVIELGGAVTRTTTDPKRRCAFEPSLYTVVTGGESGVPWVQVVPEMTKCLPGNPDRGIVALAARPNVRLGVPRYAMIFDAWGWATMIVQAPGQ
jgi:hypothetical protein